VELREIDASLGDQRSFYLLEIHTGRRLPCRFIVMDAQLQVATASQYGHGLDGGLSPRRHFSTPVLLDRESSRSTVLLS